MAFRHHSDAAKIEVIRVPAGLDRRFRLRQPIRVMSASELEKVKLGVVEIEEFAPQFGGKLGPTSAMFVIHDRVDPP